jgi:hypothetical protein
VSDHDAQPAEYVAEQIRSALAREAHELGIAVIVSGDTAVLEGRVESERQRITVEQVARQVAPQLKFVNRIGVATLAGTVRKESMD